MRIIGAGMAGLLAGNMLRRYQPNILEANKKLPDNHGALLRFRSNVVAEAVGQQFREVSVMKAMRHSTGMFSSGPPDLSQVNRYAIKVTGRAMPRSIMNLDTVQRWIAPDDFLEVLAQGVGGQIFLDSYVNMDGIRGMVEQGFPIISTIPMGSLMSMMPGWEDREPIFPRTPIWSLRARIMGLPEVDVHQTIYYPGREPFYRASITGNLLTVEYLQEPAAVGQTEGLRLILQNDFGIEVKPDNITFISTYFQPLGKILPIDEEMRREFILEMTDRYKIYSLGRFATWRQILLDDVVNDIRMIDKWITGRDSYRRRIES